MERMPNLSDLKQLEELYLATCKTLTEIQGLEELTALRELDLRECLGLDLTQVLEALASIRILRFGDDKLPLLKYNLTKPLCQMYSEFGHEIEINVYWKTQNWESELDWISESPYWTGQSSSNLYSTVLYAQLLPNESHNFMGLILCFYNSGTPLSYSVKNTTSGFIWRHTHGISSPNLIVIVPKSIFSVSDDDHIIEFTAGINVEMVGIQLLYKTETQTRDVVKKNETGFDELKLVDPELQDIFLDIACFFIGWNGKEVVQILKTYYSNVDHNIDLLKKRCLLKINDCDELEMDHLLQQIGRKIARNNSPDEPGKHSRLWLSTDICDVLKTNQGTEAIQGIITQFGWNAHQGESFTGETSKRVSKLRFLYLDMVNFTGSFDQAFKELRWFRCSCCPLKCFPSDFYPQELVTLELPCSSLTAIWEPNMVPCVFGKLKNLNMSNSRDLVTTPDFIELPCLEILNLNSCKSLEEVHQSIGSLASLVSLDLYGCVKLRSLPDTICKLRALQVPTISQCNSLEALPIKLGNIESLTKLNAGGLTVSHLPESTGYLPKLVELDVSKNKKLETLPDTICKMRSLEVLNLDSCSSLETLPMAFGDIEALKALILSGLTVSKLPNSIGNLSKLVELNLSHNEKLETLPDTICNLRWLEFLNIDSCRSLDTLPMAIGNIESLKEIRMSGLRVSKLPDSIGSLTKLVELYLGDNDKLKTLPKLPPNLKSIYAFNCISLERLPNLLNLKHLETLDLSGCRALTEILGGLTYIQGLEGLASIRILRLPGHLTKGMCQMYSEFGHRISVYTKDTVNRRSHPDWITELPFWTAGSSESFTWNSNQFTWSNVNARLLTNESHNFMGLILCFENSQDRESNNNDDYSVVNITSGFIWWDSLAVPSFDSQLMVIVPKSIFLVSDEDHIIECTGGSDLKIVGIHPLYKIEETKTIQDVVRKHETSFDALKLVDPELQDIFLDIASFFIGWKAKEVVQILKTYYSNVYRNINVLIERRLLMINACHELEMDDLLRHTGRKIARNNSPDEPGKNSRLWLSIDIYI